MLSIFILAIATVIDSVFFIVYLVRFGIIDNSMGDLVMLILCIGFNFTGMANILWVFRVYWFDFRRIMKIEGIKS
jgi:hypothetical protein